MYNSSIFPKQSKANLFIDGIHSFDNITWLLTGVRRPVLASHDLAQVGHRGPGLSAGPGVPGLCAIGVQPGPAF